MDIEKISNGILIAQQYAITHQKAVVVNFSRINGSCEIREFVSKKEIDSFQLNTKIIPMVSVDQMQMKITNDGSFSKSGSFYFDTPVGKYRFVLLLGQGRFYYEKV